MGVDGYRRMAVYPARKEFQYGFTTIHKYMVGLRSIVRRKKSGYRHGTVHKVYNNLLQQDFTAERPNQKWCMDFTYLFLKNGEVRYNCIILDLFDRSAAASIMDRNITSELAVRTLQKALDSQQVKAGLLLHSDQSSQFTSQAFTDFCTAAGVTQCMGKAGYPFDNAPMERYFNSLKNECTTIFKFLSEDSLYLTVEEFACATCNYVRPRTFNIHLTPGQTHSTE